MEHNPVEIWERTGSVLQTALNKSDLSAQDVVALGITNQRETALVWNRKTGRVVATGNIVVTNPRGDQAYGDSIELTDSLKDGVVDNMLVVLDRGGRLAAQRGSRDTAGVVTLENAAFTPCSVVDSKNCPKEPSWKITAVSSTCRIAAGSTRAGISSSVKRSSGKI